MEEKSFRYENAKGDRVVSQNEVRTKSWYKYKPKKNKINQEMYLTMRELKLPKMEYCYLKVEENTNFDVDGLDYMCKMVVDILTPEKITNKKKGKSIVQKVVLGLGVLKDDCKPYYRGKSVVWNPNLKKGDIKFTFVYKSKN